MLPAALWRPGRLALCLYMFRGVILRSAGLQAAPGGFQRGADKALVQLSWRWGNACSAWVSGPWAGGIGRSTDRPLTVGVDVDGQHAAPEARLEWQTRHGRTLRTLGMDPCQLLLGCRRDGLGDRRRRRPGQEPDRRLPAACGKRFPGSEPRKVSMVRRRSTVRFRKGAPGYEGFSNAEPSTSPAASGS